MSRKYAVPLLVVAALAVLAENIVFFRSVPVSWDETVDLDGSDSDSEVEETLAPLDADALSHFLASLSGQQDERNPFLTRLEADSLRPRSFGHAQTSGQARAPRLDGILWSVGHRVAWLDGRPRNEGDVVRGHRIERIAPRTVTLRAAESQLQLRLKTAAPRKGGSPASTRHEEEVEDHGE